MVGRRSPRGILVGVLLYVLAGTAAAQGWPAYPVIMWQPETQAAYAALAAMGVTAGKVFAPRNHSEPMPPPAGLGQSGLRFYVESIATDFYSAYHRYRPGLPPNWSFRRARAARDFVRDPSLSDPVWLARVQDRVRRTVRAYAPDRPLFYSLGDETGIADLAVAWDFDVSPESVAAMRVWLRGEYGSLEALDAEWGTHHAAWDEVQPELTTAAMARAGDNFAAWSDFKAWMDVAFARAVRAGTDAAHATDPGALAGIEGAQVPGWGGYDYTRLSRAVDVMEVYDFGESLEIAGGLNPGLVLLSTTSLADRQAEQSTWRYLLRGTRGLILWDPEYRIVRADGSPGPRAPAARRLLPELRRTAALLAGAERVIGPVAVLYSPASLRAEWMLDQRAGGAAWMRRSASAEGADNPARAAMEADVETLLLMGVQPRIVDPAMLRAGALAHGVRVLLLPRIWAMDDAEAAAIRAFRAAGGAVIANGPPGVFDGHLRRRAVPALDGHEAIQMDAAEAGFPDALGRAVLAAGVRPFATLVPRDAEVHVFKDGAGAIVAILGDMPGPRTLVLRAPAQVTDMATGTVRSGTRFDVRLGTAPTILRVTSDATPPQQAPVRPPR